MLLLKRQETLLCTVGGNSNVPSGTTAVGSKVTALQSIRNGVTI